MQVQMNRRRVFGLGAGITAGLFEASALSARAAETSADRSLSWKLIENIIQAQGMYFNGVFSIEIDRNDIDYVTLHGVPIKPAFQINGSLFFQKLSDNVVIMNGDMPLKADEVDPFIDQLVAHGIQFQALHQHFYDFDPLVWFIHFRQKGEADDVARGIKAALDATATPFPQMSPQNPTTPLPAEVMGRILGAAPHIGSDGVVTYFVPREDPVILGGVRVNPYLNVETNIVFEPLQGGKTAAAAPDFGMIAREINPLVQTMRRQGWDIGCLYNQETDEYPQLYFSHQFKTGDPIQLAREIRRGLNLMDLKFK